MIASQTGILPFGLLLFVLLILGFLLLANTNLDFGRLPQPTDTKKYDGLSREHHSELNRVLDVEPSRYDELRTLYKDDPVALQQIDVYDTSSPYGLKLQQFIEACKTNNEPLIRELERWFAENYPYIK